MSGPGGPWRAHVWGLQPVPHGGAAQLAARGLDPAAVLDFSATLLPGGPDPAVTAALRAADPGPYPDPESTRLRRALAEAHGRAPAEVLPAAGSVALIRAIAQAALAPGDRALVAAPTFGEYAQAARVAGAEPVEVAAPDVDALLAALDRVRPRLVFLCSPNNPTGRRWSQAEVEALAARCWLVLDEAYAGFLDPTPPPPRHPRLIVLRSMTKEHALAGVRLGYAIGPAAVLAPLAQVLPPWSVSSAAQAAGLAALAAGERHRRRIRALWRHRAALVAALRAEGLEVQAGDAPFFLVRLPGEPAGPARPGATPAARWSAALLERGLLVRDATSFGLPEHVRISPRDPAAHRRLLAAFHEFLPTAARSC